MVTFAENKVRQGTRGYRYDAETQNYYVRNRYYLPTLGRWLTRDPIGYQGGINLYEYVQSSPVGNVDAAGLAVSMNAIRVLNHKGRLSLGFKSTGGRICSASLLYDGKKIASARIPAGGWGPGEHQISFNGEDLLVVPAKIATLRSLGVAATDPRSLVLKTNVGSDSARVTVASKLKRLQFTGDMSAFAAEGGPEDGWGVLGHPLAMPLHGHVSYHRLSVLAGTTLSADFVGPSDKYWLGGVPPAQSGITSIEADLTGVGSWKAWTPSNGWVLKPGELITSAEHVGYYWFDSAKITASLVGAMGDDGPLIINPVLSAIGQANSEKVTL